MGNQLDRVDVSATPGSLQMGTNRISFLGTRRRESPSLAPSALYLLPLLPNKNRKH